MLVPVEVVPRQVSPAARMAARNVAFDYLHEYLDDSGDLSEPGKAYAVQEAVDLALSAAGLTVQGEQEERSR